MKRFICQLSIVACLIGASLFAADPLGPPKAGLAQGQFGVAVEYSYAEMDLVREHMTFGSNIASSYKVDDMNTAYFSVGYGVTDWLEVFARIGGVNLESHDELTWGPMSTFSNDLDTDFIYGGGVRATFGCVGDVTFGGVATYSYTQMEGDFFLEDWNWTGDVDFRMQQIQVALGATWALTERVAVYGGGLIHHVRIHHGRETTFGMTSEHLAENDGVSDMLGGYLGTKVGLTDNMYLTIEGSYTSDSHGGSASIGWNF